MGRYTLAARTIVADKPATPALVGAQCGSTLNPRGGDFGPTFTVSFVQSKDSYGRPIVISTPRPLWFRPSRREPHKTPVDGRSLEQVRQNAAVGVKG